MFDPCLEHQAKAFVCLGLFCCPNGLMFDLGFLQIKERFTTRPSDIILGNFLPMYLIWTDSVNEM